MTRPLVASSADIIYACFIRLSIRLDHTLLRLNAHFQLLLEDDYEYSGFLTKEKLVIGKRYHLCCTIKPPRATFQTVHCPNHEGITTINFS